MSPHLLLRDILRPGLETLYSLGGPTVTHNAERMLLAIAGQEADWRIRYQHSPAETPGPARSFWQFEQSGVNGVLTNSASRSLAEIVCRHFWVQRHTGAIWRAMEGHDALAVCFARLLLWRHRDPLPTSEPTAWGQYLDLWRPGRPSPNRWPERWRQATEAVFNADR